MKIVMIVCFALSVSLYLLGGEGGCVGGGGRCPKKNVFTTETNDTEKNAAFFFGVTLE